MINTQLKQQLTNQVLLRVQQPVQYVGDELNIIRKDHRELEGKLCLAFPDTYALGMSHHGLQVLYALMNREPKWCCERVFTPWSDMEEQLQWFILLLDI